MVNTIKFWLERVAKEYEIRLRTWKNKRAIDAAYSSGVDKPRQPERKIEVRPGLLRRIGIVAVGICVACLLVAVAPRVVKKIHALAVATLQRIDLPRQQQRVNHAIHSMKVQSMKRPTARPAARQNTFGNLDTVPRTTVPEPLEPGVIHDTGAAPPASGLSESWSIPEEAQFIIVVNKATKTFFLLRKDKKWSVFRRFSIAIGENSGRKVTSGDKKTPEGTYFIVGKKEKSELTPIYGPLAYVLNYPNAEDRKEGRTGQGIWIHGTYVDSVPIRTKGCVELHNENILELESFLRTGIGTPIVIVDKLGAFDPLLIPQYAQIERDRKTVLAGSGVEQQLFVTLLTQWKKAWESEDIKRYAQFYDTATFSGQGLGWKAWKTRKLATFAAYSRISVSVEHVLVADLSDTNATVKFLQRYDSDAGPRENGKKLLFAKTLSGWKISRENTFPKEELFL